MAPGTKITVNSSRRDGDMVANDPQIDLLKSIDKSLKK